MVEIETVFSIVFSQWYGIEVMVFFRADLRQEALAYNNSGGVIMQQQVNLADINGRNTLLRQLKTNLAKVVVFKQTILYKSRRYH